MKKMYKGMLLVLCAILLVVASVMGTLAYLQDNTKTISNVMTVGNVKITLSESVVDIYGKVTTGKIVADANGVTGGSNSYKLVPGATYTKDPTIHVEAGSEACWVFVKIDNGIKNIIEEDTVEGQMTTWTCIDTVNGIWAYNEKAVAGQDVVVFTSFKIKGEANIASYAGKTIDVTAYAVQAEGFANAKAAWDATFGANS
jgi:hypothetical protein